MKHCGGNNKQLNTSLKRNYSRANLILSLFTSLLNITDLAILNICYITVLSICCLLLILFVTYSPNIKNSEEYSE